MSGIGEVVFVSETQDYKDTVGKMTKEELEWCMDNLDFLLEQEKQRVMALSASKE